MNTNITDLLKLYDDAKEAYYNGNPIMGDIEFDALERELGLMNKGYVGEHHSANFTVKHPFIMGSLSKVQIKRNKSGVIDWDDYATQINKYLTHTHKYPTIDITPKYDGCSFELQRNKKGTFQVSTRGDGQWGKDISIWFLSELNKPHWNIINAWCEKHLDDDIKLIIRGEVLVDKQVFNNKYADKFTNPRSFVAGIIGQDFIGTIEQCNMRDDLSFVCYNYRLYDTKTNKQYILDYQNDCPFGIKPELHKRIVTTLTGKDLQDIYDEYAKFRETCPYTLDGVVFKPSPAQQETDSVERPKDCVAMKFLPEIIETTITDIEWSVGKTGELFPVAIFESVKLDNKDVTRASLHNYGFIKNNNIGIGTKIKISLAGDIIPFIFEVIGTKTADFTIPQNADIDNFDGIHLMTIMSDDDKRKNRFLTSCRAMNIEGIGPKIAERIFACGKYSNINDVFVDLYETEESFTYRIQKEFSTATGESKTADNIINALKERIKKLTVKDIITACAFPFAGEHITTACANYYSSGEADFTGLNRAGYSWVLDKNTKEYSDVYHYVTILGAVSTPVKTNNENKVYVILTGSPKECGFKTKNDFLAKHPEYEETTNWKKVKIVFTDDLESNSSKMQKAHKLNIEIKRYE